MTKDDVEEIITLLDKYQWQLCNDALTRYVDAPGTREKIEQKLLSLVDEYKNDTP